MVVALAVTYKMHIISQRADKVESYPSGLRIYVYIVELRWLEH